MTIEDNFFEKGDTGEKGDPGEKGITGKTGAKGATGEKGDSGVNGTNAPNIFYTWFSTREPLITFTFFIILSVLSFATVYSARQTQAAIKKADLIVQCTTPGTPCYNFAQQAALQRTKEIKASSFCIISTVSQFPFQDWQSRQAELLAVYNTCVATASK